MIYSINDIKTIDNDLTGLNEVRILDKHGRLKKTVIAKRIEHDPGYKNLSKIHQKKKLTRKLKASDLIEIANG